MLEARLLEGLKDREWSLSCGYNGLDIQLKWPITGINRRYSDQTDSCNTSSTSHINIHFTFSTNYHSGLFHSLFWNKLKSFVGVKGLRKALKAVSPPTHKKMVINDPGGCQGMEWYVSNGNCKSAARPESVPSSYQSNLFHKAAIEEPSIKDWLNDLVMSSVCINQPML